MKKIGLIILFYVFVTGCSKLFMEDPPADNPRENFNSLWSTIDEKYSFFTLKNIDWDQVKTKYESEVTDDISNFSLFYVFSDMLNELRDGHVNIYGGFDVSRNWSWYLDYPQNFDYEVIERNYLGNNYFISGGLKTAVLRSGDSTGNFVLYTYYESFLSGVAYINQILDLCKNNPNCSGYILDVRDNGGGALTNAKKIAEALTDRERLVLKEYHKNGKVHDDFSEVIETTILPANNFSKPVVILSNRKCYSAASFFCAMTKQIPNVIIAGDTTGGGSGLPTDYELPNGWRYRFSTTKTEYYEPSVGKFVDFELGVPPDIVLPDIPKDSLYKGVDTWIEYAKNRIYTN